MNKSYKLITQFILIAAIVLPINNYNNSFADVIAIPIEDYKKLNQKQIQEKVERRRLEIEKQEADSKKVIKYQDKNDLSNDEDKRENADD